MRLEAEAHVTPAPSPAQRRSVLAQVERIARAWEAVNAVGQRKIVNVLASSVALAQGQAPAFVWLTAEST